MSAIADAASILTERCHGRVTIGGAIAPLTTYRLGGPAGILVEPADEDDLRALADAVRASGVEVLIIGRGSNMLVSDQGFDGIAVRLGAGFRWAERDGTRLRAGAAMPLPALASLAMREHLAGLAFGVAIPASLGGAVRMNAGAHGAEMADVLDTVDVFSLTSGSASVLAKDELGLSYRRSSLPAGSVVTGATLALAEGKEQDIVRAMDEAKDWRRATQPINLPNGGSVFTNPDGEAAGSLIERIVGKGTSVGGARVSEIHANFIVVEDGARADHVYSLMRKIQRAVEEDAGVHLEPELKLIGTFQEVVDG